MGTKLKKRRPKYGYIDRLGLGELVTKWIFEDRLTYQQVADKLKAEHDLEISKDAVKNYRKFIISSVPDFLNDEEEYRKKVAKTYLDTVENLAYLVSKLKEEIDKFPEKAEWRQRATFYNNLIPVVMMLVKRAGEIKPAQFIKNENYQINMMQVNQVIQEQIVRLIDNGDIPLELCSEKVKQFYRKLKGLNAFN